MYDVNKGTSNSTTFELDRKDQNLDIGGRAIVCVCLWDYEIDMPCSETLTGRRTVVKVSFASVESVNDVMKFPSAKFDSHTGMTRCNEIS